MTLTEAFDAIKNLYRPPNNPNLTFNYITYGGPNQLFNAVAQTDGYYPTKALWHANGGRGGAYLYVDDSERVLYIGKSCGSQPHGPSGRGISAEAISKVSKPGWISKSDDLFDQYTLSSQFAARASVSPREVELVKCGRFYFGFIVVANERQWPISPTLQRVARDLEGHLLYVHKQKHNGALPPLNQRDDSVGIDTTIPWGS